MPLPGLPTSSSLPPWMTQLPPTPVGNTLPFRPPIMPVPIQRDTRTPITNPNLYGHPMQNFYPTPANRYGQPVVQPNLALRTGAVTRAVNAGPSASAIGRNLGDDYANIVGGYQQLVSAPPTTFSDITPERISYSESPEAAASLRGLSELAATGGLSGEQQADLRARGISPIRSIYSNALRNLNRSTALSGGYNPGVGAAQSRMAREQSEQIAGATTNVNAEIARMIQQGRLSAAPQYERATGERTAALNRIAEINAQNALRAQEANAAGRLRANELNNQRLLETLQGRGSLLGTYGSLAEAQNRLQQEGGLGLISAYLRATGA